MSAKKILFLVGDFAEDYEVMVPFQALTMLGHIVHAVCPGKKAGEKIKTAVHDFEGDQTYTEKPGHNFTLNARFAEVKAEGYDALMAGGEYVETSPDGAIRDGNLVTGFAWPAHPQWLALFLEVLGTRVSL